MLDTFRPQTPEAAEARQRGRDIADRAIAAEERGENGPAVSFGTAGSAFGTGGDDRSGVEKAAGSAKVWVPFRRFVVRKESPQVAKIAKDIGLLPSAGSGKTLPAEHALSEKLGDSPWISASERRKGAPKFEGEPVRIDVEEAIRTGSEYISHEELQKHVADYEKVHPERVWFPH